MHLEEPIKRDFSYVECLVLMKILNHIEEEHLTQASLARAINTSVTSPLFNNIIKYLVEKKIITKHAFIGNCIKLDINEKLLCELIDEQEVVETIYEYLKSYHFATW